MAKNQKIKIRKKPCQRRIKPLENHRGGKTIKGSEPKRGPLSGILMSHRSNSAVRARCPGFRPGRPVAPGATKRRKNSRAPGTSGNSSGPVHRSALGPPPKGRRKRRGTRGRGGGRSTDKDPR